MEMQGWTSSFHNSYTIVETVRNIIMLYILKYVTIRQIHDARISLLCPHVKMLCPH